MKKNYLLLFLLSLIGWSSGAWAQEIQPSDGTDERFIDSAIAGTENLSFLSLDINDGGNSTIERDNAGNILINREAGVSTTVKGDGNVNRPTVTVSFRINLATPTSYEKIVTLSSASSANNTSIGIGARTDGKISATWRGDEWGGSSNPTLFTNVLSSGSHIITLVVGQSDNGYGTRIYVDGSVVKYSNGGLKCSEFYKYVIFNPAYSSFIDAVYVFNTAVTDAQVQTITQEISSIESQVQTKYVTFKVYDAADHSRLFYTQQNVAQVIGAAPSLTGLPSYVTATYNVNAISEETTEVNAYTTATLPFEVGQMYTISLYGKYAYIPSAEETTVGQTTTAYTSTTYENYEWFFTGNWYEGFEIYNPCGQGIGTANGTANGNAASFGQPALFEYEKVSDSKWVLKVKGSNPAAYLAHTSSSSSTINFYYDKGNAGTGITLGTVNLNNYTVHINVPEGYATTGLTATIADQAYQDNQNFEYAGTLTTANVIASNGDLLQAPVVEIVGNDINITYTENPYLSTSETTVYVRINNLYKTQVDFGNTPQYAYSSGNSIYVPGNASINPFSAIWKLVKAANNSGVYLENLSTGLQFKGFGTAPAAQGTLMHIYPNSNNNRTGYAICNATSGDNIAWVLDGGTGNLTVKYAQTSWQSAVWQLEQISEEQAAEMMRDYLLSVVEQAKDQKNGVDTQKPFTAKSDVLKPLIDALSQEGGLTPENVAAFKQAL
ncbi:MAG: hypothetical protein KBT12_00280, partial [Bacteroidales bacterium]|nr:hypothetical protein [Candidatus Physcousia equi]